MAIAAAVSTIIQGFGLYIISDLRDRVVRLENKMMERNSR